MDQEGAETLPATQTNIHNGFNNHVSNLNVYMYKPRSKTNLDKMIAHEDHGVENDVFQQ